MKKVKIPLKSNNLLYDLNSLYFYSTVTKRKKPFLGFIETAEKLTVLNLISVLKFKKTLFRSKLNEIASFPFEFLTLIPSLTS